MLLKDKVVIVSGIGPGLGIKLAVEAAREGAKGLILAARTASKLDDAEAAVNELHGSCEVLKIPTDIRNADDCQNLVSKTLAQFGRIDALFNSAYEHGNFETADAADLSTWKSVVDTNLIGSMQLTQAVIPSMKAQKQGAIVMISSMATRKPFSGEAGYAAAKAALGTAAKYLAVELGQYGIRINTAAMGWMWGAPVQGFVKMSAEQQNIEEDSIVAGVAKNIPLGRIPTDDECARAALFLASDYASAITGATLDVNGGEFIPT